MIPESDTQVTEIKPEDLFTCDYEAIFSTFLSDISAIEIVIEIENMGQLDIRDKMFLIEILDTSLDFSDDCFFVTDDILSVREKVIISALSYLPKLNECSYSNKTLLKIQTIQEIE